MNVSKTFMSFCMDFGLNVPKITEQALRGTKIGKILRRELIAASPCYKNTEMELSLNCAVQTGVCYWNAGLHVERLTISDRYEDYIRTYNNATVHSCMTGEAEKFAEFYIRNHVKIAYLTLDGHITARTLISGNIFTELYGTQIKELHTALLELGYVSYENTHEQFLPKCVVIPKNSDGNYYLPHIDTYTTKLWVQEWESSSNMGIQFLDVFNPFDSDIWEQDWEIENLLEWEQLLGELEPDRIITQPHKKEVIINHETFQQVQYTLLPVHQKKVEGYQIEYKAIIARKYEELDTMEDEA